MHVLSRINVSRTTSPQQKHTHRWKWYNNRAWNWKLFGFCYIYFVQLISLELAVSWICIGSNYDRRSATLQQSAAYPQRSSASSVQTTDAAACYIASSIAARPDARAFAAAAAAAAEAVVARPPPTTLLNGDTMTPMQLSGINAGVGTKSLRWRQLLRSQLAATKISPELIGYEVSHDAMFGISYSRARNVWRSTRIYVTTSNFARKYFRCFFVQE